jgi:hypothetical protein
MPLPHSKSTNIKWTKKPYKIMKIKIKPKKVYKSFMRKETVKTFKKYSTTVSLMRTIQLRVSESVSNKMIINNTHPPTTKTTTSTLLKFMRDKIQNTNYLPLIIKACFLTITPNPQILKINLLNFSPIETLDLKRNPKTNII